MKRTFTQKVKQVPSSAADSFEALLKLYIGKQSVGATVPTEVNHRARTSAAMIGLAISMGAAGLLLPQQGDEAMAQEAVATEPNLPTLAIEPSTSVDSAPAVTSVVAASTPTPIKQETAVDLTSTPSPVVEHRVREGETLWELSKSYQIQPEAIAVSNNIQSSAVLPVGQKLKIPPVNGIVHEVKTGETIETLSESYGVKPTQLQASALPSETSQLQAGESVTVPGNVNDLLKARQEIALNSLKEQGNRLNDSLAELRSEESINLSQQETGVTEVASAAKPATPVTLPSTAFKTEESVANASKPTVGAPTSPVTLPVPSPQITASGTIEPLSAKTPESSVVISVPTPEIASSPFKTPSSAKTPESSVVISVPTPEIASSPSTTPSSPTTPNSRIEPVTTQEAAAKPKVPQPVVIPTLTSSTSANLYQVKPGDTLEAIARRHGLSSSELIRTNGLNNPNVLNVNQQLKIPQAQSALTTTQPFTLLSGANSKTGSSASGQQVRSVATPLLAAPTVSNRVTPVVPTQPQSQAQSLQLPVSPSTRVSNAKPTSTVVETQPSDQVDSKANPYIDRLRSDILKLREDFGQQPETTQASAPRNVVVPSVTKPAPSRGNNPTPIRINPEFNPKRSNESLQADLQRRQQQQAQQGPINIEVPPPAAAASLPPRGLVASAPAPTDRYNPSLRTPVGETVSPEIPALYPPDSPTQSNSYIWPAKGVLTSGYGWRWGRMHKGIDIAAPVGTPVVAAAPGVVAKAGWNSGGYGNLVEIQHPDGSLTLYAHNNRILVRRGQEVTQGQQIAEMGSTGHSTGPHTHFEVHTTGRGAVNPIAFLPRQ
ncbi:Putative peptidase [uncultured Coleofasciculus sp.]|uniref:Peptidase n=1 Tax=uncultured Coleofasciculus sp. TaxID=1267456 RepID=A0A6J4KE84_9CYAN|nr:Putative peptidase [uncultured Coleofasciculus sp.]